MTTSGGSSTNGDASRPGPVHRLFGEYIDRLNAGETLDADEIRREHPEHAKELIEQLSEFKAFGSRHSELSWVASIGFHQVQLASGTEYYLAAIGGAFGSANLSSWSRDRYFSGSILVHDVNAPSGVSHGRKRDSAIGTPRGAIIVIGVAGQPG